MVLRLFLDLALDISIGSVKEEIDRVGSEFNYSPRFNYSSSY